MKTRIEIKWITGIFALLLFTTTVNASIIDSIGRRIENGKIIILHKVESKQTVYAISKIYNVSQDVIYNANPTAKEALKVGQILKIPTGRNADGSAPYIAPGTSVKTHTVGKGETLYSISKIYNIKVGEIKRWNKLESSELSTGQVLKVAGKSTETVSAAPAPKVDIKGKKTHIVQKKETMYSISKQYKVDIDDLKAWNKLESSSLSEGQILVVEGTSSTTMASAKSGDQDLVITTNTSSSKPKSKPEPTPQTKPQPKPVATQPASSGTTSRSLDEDGFHTVQKGESLYAISKKYNVSVDNLKKWNQLSDNSISEGQMLLVSTPQETEDAMDILLAVNEEDDDLRKGGSKPTAATTKNTTRNTSTTTYSSNTNTRPATTNGGTPKNIDQHKEHTNTDHGEDDAVNQALAHSMHKIGEVEQQKELYEQEQRDRDLTPTPQPSQGNRDYWHIPTQINTYQDTLIYGIRSIKKNVGKYAKTVETGVCELIEDNHWDTKYNCLHAEAEIGTIIQVTQPENGKSVFVRVVGRLVEDSSHPNRVIKISHHAGARIDPGRNRMPIEISYVPKRTSDFENRPK